jgi:hypothetical protein
MATTNTYWRDLRFLTLSAKELSVSSSASDTTVILSANIDWNATSNQTWLMVSPASGTGNDTLILSAIANTDTTVRVATVSVCATSGSVLQTITITQAAGTIPTNTTNAALSKNFSVYPNPVKDALNITVPAGFEYAKYTITSTDGGVATSGYFKGLPINVNLLPKGIYTIQLTNGKATLERKFIKQ